MIKSPVFVAVVLLLLTLAAVGYQALELNKVRLGKDLSVNKPQQIVQKKQAADVPTLAQLAKRNLMGDPKKSAAKPVTENVVPIAALKLTLMGTIVKTDGGISSAFIQGSNRETKRYYVGESIEGGLILGSVAVDSVTLKRGEQVETLMYPSNTTAANAPSPVTVVGPATRPVVNRPQQAGPATVLPAGAVQPISLRERMRNGRATQPPAGQ